MLIFCHIEKAAGISVHRILHKNFPGYISPSPKKKFGVIDRSYFDLLQKFYPIPVTGIGGHKVSVIDIAKKDDFVFTIVRDPLDRFLSHLNWRTEVMGEKYCLQEYCAEEMGFCNFQCKRICGKQSADAAIATFEEHFDVVGIFEIFHESLVAISSLCTNSELKICTSVSNATSSKNRQFERRFLSESELDMIRACNLEDEKMYRWVVENYRQLILDQSAMDICKYEEEYAKIDDLKRKLSNIYLSRIVQPLLSAGAGYRQK